MNTLTMSDMAVLTPGKRPVVFACRDGTIDANIAIGLNLWGGTVGDEYRMMDRQLSGWALDIGSHIGALAISAAVDHPDLQVIAVEVVPESADLIRQNAKRNHVADRVHVVNAAAGAPGQKTMRCHWGYTSREPESPNYVSAHRLIAETWAGFGKPEFARDMPVVSLDGLMAEYGIAEVALMKIDCEGCEWHFLNTPAVAKVGTIVGEYHGGELTHIKDARKRLTQLLGKTHAIEWWREEPVIGTFEAVRR
jgi:FkbM family methyltransferase